MEEGQIPKDILYGELESGKRNTSHLQLCNRDVCKRDMKALSTERITLLTTPNEMHPNYATEVG